MRANILTTKSRTEDIRETEGFKSAKKSKTLPGSTLECL